MGQKLFPTFAFYGRYQDDDPDSLPSLAPDSDHEPEEPEEDEQEESEAESEHPSEASTETRTSVLTEEDERFAPYLPSGGMTEVAEVVAERLASGTIVVHGEGGGDPVRILGQDDFPWNDPVGLLELYHGRLDDWSGPRNPRVVPRALVQPLIYKLRGSIGSMLLDDYGPASGGYDPLGTFAPYCHCRIQQTACRNRTTVATDAGKSPLHQSFAVVQGCV